jgi:hypothetical protein
MTSKLYNCIITLHGKLIIWPDCDILVSRLKCKWSIRACLLKFFIDEIIDNVCILKWNINVEYKKLTIVRSFVNIHLIFSLNGNVFFG